jgi:energy-coupling factor transporter ATP-binding protein EcfA2
MSEYKSEIRQSDINALAQKVAGENYGKYLRRVTLKKIRGFEDRSVSFDFPVTAIVGPNGHGKTTVLGAAGLIYKAVKPRRFFAKSGKYDATMKDWVIEYELIDKQLNPRLPVQRTASFLKAKWNRTAVDRDVLVFGVERTVPATERTNLVRAMGNKFAAAREVPLTAEVAQSVERILGRRIAGFSRLDVDKAGRVTMFAGQTPNGSGYSEFHFGAGEASVIRMVGEIEAAADNSLILIEEIENGLHPVAVKRMVHYLLDVATRKSCQVVFTTHSNDALDPLPSDAIWSAVNGELNRGKLDIVALRTITGQVDARLAIFVEDRFAEDMAKTMLRYFGGVELSAVKVHGMGGAVPAMQVNAQHNVDPTRRFPSICLLDGDQADSADAAAGVFVLPGTGAPEAHVFARVHDKIDELANRLAVSLHLQSSDQDRVKQVVKERALTAYDPHVVFRQIGDDLDFLAEQTVVGAFLAVWAQEYPDEIRTAVEPFADRLPSSSS